VLTYFIGARPAPTRSSVASNIATRRPSSGSRIVIDNLIVVLSAVGSLAADRGETTMSEDGWSGSTRGVKLWRRIGGTLLMAGAPAPDGSDRIRRRRDGRRGACVRRAGSA